MLNMAENKCEVAERLEQQGRKEGRETLVYEFVGNKTITLQQGADALNISVEELEEKMKDVGTWEEKLTYENTLKQWMLNRFLLEGPLPEELTKEMIDQLVVHRKPSISQIIVYDSVEDIKCEIKKLHIKNR